MLDALAACLLQLYSSTGSSSSMGHRRAREHFRIWCSTVPGVPAAFAHAEVENTVALENCTIKYIHFYSHLPLNVSIFDTPRNLLNSFVKIESHTKGNTKLFEKLWTFEFLVSPARCWFWMGASPLAVPLAPDRESLIEKLPTYKNVIQKNSKLVDREYKYQ